MFRPAVICLMLAFVSFMVSTPNAYRHRKAPAEVQRQTPIQLDDDDDDDREAILDESEEERDSARRRRV